MKRIALATSEGFPELSEDDRGLISAFSRQGFVSEPVIWSHPNEDWAAYDAVVIRSCWDYWKNRDKFVQWVKRLKESHIPLFNPADIIEWNTEKSYLQNLHQQGIPIPPTEWMIPSSSLTGTQTTAPMTLTQIMDKNHWQEVVLKPMVSAGAFMTFRIDRNNAKEGDQKLREILRLKQCQGAMIQPFLPEILSDGEISLIFFGGEFSYAVRKKGPPGEFRIQPQYGGLNTGFTPSQELLDFAKKVLALIPEPLLYARVDLLESSEILLMELELTEPNLFFRTHQNSTDLFVNAFQRLS